MPVPTRFYKRFQVDSGPARLAIGLLLSLVGSFVLAASTDRTPWYTFLTETMYYRYRFLLLESISLLPFVLPALYFARTRTAGALVASAVIAVLTFVNSVKLEYLGTSIVCTDIYAFSNLEVLHHYEEVRTAINSAICFTLAAIVFAIRGGRGSWIRYSKMPKGAAGSQWVLLPFCFSIFWICGLTQEASIARQVIAQPLQLPWTQRWDERKFAARTGIMNVFWHSFSKSAFRRPAGLTLEDSKNAIAAYPVVPATESVKRSLVIIQLESFIDPNLLPVEYSEDAIPKFRARMQAAGTHYVDVPAVYARTANTEFEVLTGISLNELPPSTVPFVNLLVRPMHSIARTFADNGYLTYAIHNVDGHSWRRHTAWPLLGFQQVEFLKDESKEENKWPNDRPLFQTVLRRLDSTSSPQLILAVTVGTHGPHAAWTEDPPPIRVLSTKIGTDWHQRALETYLKAMKNLDDELDEFLTELEKRGVDYIAYGDHYPSIADSWIQGIAAEPVLDDKADEYLDVPRALARYTPGLISIANSAKTAVPKRIAAHCLGNVVLRAKGLALNPIDLHAENYCRESDYLRYSDFRKKQNPHLAQSKNIAFDVLNSSLGLPAPDERPLSAVSSARAESKD